MASKAKEMFDEIRAKYEAEKREKEEQKREKEEKQLHNLRQCEIGQKVKKFKSPSAKRAVSYLLDDKNDWEDCYNEFKCLVGDDGNFISLNENKDKVELFLKFFVKFSNMRTRKCKKELESYEIANRSVFGWQTEKCFNDNLFDSSMDTKWYEEEEEPPAKKLKRLREAERAVASHTRQSHVNDCDDDIDDDY